MEDIKNYIGKKINHVTVLGVYESEENPTSKFWEFKCDCGNTFYCFPSVVLSGHKKSCGCLKKNQNKTHGMWNSGFYHTWWSMMQRCYNPEHHNYPNYGARGIKVCEEWHKVENFVAWARLTVGKKDRKLTVDRIDVNGDYCPENCRWATNKEQSRNMRTNRIETIDGISKPFSEWCEEYNIATEVVYQRCNTLGWKFETALKTPVGSRNPDNNNSNFSTNDIIIEIDGEKGNISFWCNKFGTSRQTAYRRISRGWDLVKAVKTPPTVRTYNPSLGRMND